MALQVNDILRVVAGLVFEDDVIMQNVFHLLLKEIVGTGSDSEVAADLETYLEAIYSEFEGAIVNTVASTSLTIYVWDDVGLDWDEVFLELWSFVGTSVQEMLPHGVAAVQSYTTTEPDVRGRKFFGGLAEDSQDASQLTGGVITILAAGGVEIISEYTDAVSGNVYTPGVWSPTREAFFDYGGTILTNAITGYQRRRKPGVGI